MYLPADLGKLSPMSAGMMHFGGIKMDGQRRYGLCEKNYACGDCPQDDMCRAWASFVDKHDKVKSYAHFDKRVSLGMDFVRKYVMDEAKVAAHSFYPFIHFEKKNFRYGRKGPKKPRELYYCSHMDRCVYQRYAFLINYYYNIRAKEKGIDKETIIKALEDAINQSYDKKSGEEPRTAESTTGLEKKRRVEFDRETGELRVYIQKKIVEKVEDENTQISLEEVRKEDPDFELDEIVEVDVTPSDFESLGRVVAHQAKSLMIQQMKEKEREMICEEFRNKIGEVVTCVVQSVEEYEYHDRRTNRSEIRRNVYVQVGKIEGGIPGLWR